MAIVPNGVAYHGGAMDEMTRRFPNAPQPWLDLSTGINPWPYPIDPGVLQGLAQLPQQSDYVQLCNAVAGLYGTSPDYIVPANGSEGLIWLLPNLLAQVGQSSFADIKIAVAQPTYGDYARAWESVGATVLCSSQVLSLAGEVDVLVVANPNNPDGRIYTKSSLLQALARQQSRGGYLLVDEAFGDLVPDLSLMSHAGAPGLLMLRSFGKFFGLPGLRLGWLAGPGVIIEALRRQQGVWPINTLTLEVARQAYTDLSWQQATRAKLCHSREHLLRCLSKTVLQVAGYTDLFVWLKDTAASNRWHTLAQQGVAVRYFPTEPGFLRIGLPKNEQELARLINVL